MGPEEAPRAYGTFACWALRRFRRALPRAFRALIAFCFSGEKLEKLEDVVDTEDSMESSDPEGDPASGPSMTGSSGGPCLLPLLPWHLRREGRFGAAFGAA